ncbi:MAG: immunoglobulin domain-containing protein [Verrucomicrobia bacterium]|nr:immunoglobulin domain-containing protein [Verrucomicrobiota bacterium]
MTSRLAFTPAARFGLGLLAALLSAAPALAQTTSSPPLAATTLAGRAGTGGSDDGTGTAAAFLNPSGLVVDRSGNLFVADTGNNTIRKITPAGVISTFAGRAVDPETGIKNNGGSADGTGPAAEFNFGKSIIDSIGSNTLAIDASGNLYVADTLNNAIRRITPAAVVTTLQLRDSSGNGVSLNSPDGVAIDSSSNLYITDSGTNTIRRVTLSGIVTTLAGSPTSGSTDGTGNAASFSNPRGIACDAFGNVYVADTNNHTIRKITPAGVVTTLAGSPGTSTRNSAGSSDGLGKNARFNGPIGLGFDAAGNLYVADRGNHSIRKITSAGLVSTVAGLSGTAGSADGTGNAARLRNPYSVAADASGTLYIADTKNHVIRKAVAITSPPTISIQTQPAIRIVTTGQSATFSVTASATPAPSYQWLRNGTTIAGANAASYTLAPALSDDRSYYSVVVTSGTLSFTSTAAQLQVYPPSVTIPPVIILTHPADQTVSAGSGATLSVEATGNPATLTYQWQKGTTDIAGATNADYNLPSPQTSDSGIYQVIVSNAGTSVTSNPATLNVTPVTVVAPTIATQPQSLTVSAGQSASFSVAASGTPAPTYQWQKDGNPVSGATFPSFTLIAAQSGDAGTYRVVVTNQGGSVTSTGAVLTVAAAATAPAITSQPVAASVKVGERASFTVVATGSPAPTFQWQKDGVAIAGATTATFSIASAQLTDDAAYRVVVSNAAGTVTSVPAALTVAPAFVDTGRLINLSILTDLAAGETMTMGTALGGAGTTGTKPLVARAAGPALTQLGVTGVLPDPTMNLNSTSVSPAVLIAANNDWGGSTALGNAFAQVGAFPYASAASKDAGMFQPTLATGNYTVEVRDAGTGTGTVIAELYDATPSGTFTVTTPRLINVSVLKTIAAGTTLTAGFVIGGTTGRTVLIRAVGPTLGAAPFNIGGVMADPKLELFNNATNTKINENNDWAAPVAPLTSTSAQLTTAFGSVGAFVLAGATTKDAVLLVTLAPGQYSARVSGADAGGGMALVEVYEAP